MCPGVYTVTSRWAHQCRSQDGGRGGGCGGWGPAPNLGAASPQVCCWGLCPRTPAVAPPHTPAGAAPQTPAGAAPQTPAGATSQTPAGAAPQTPAGRSAPDTAGGSHPSPCWGLPPQPPATFLRQNRPRVWGGAPTPCVHDSIKPTGLVRRRVVKFV